MMEPKQRTEPRSLVCVECGREDLEADGWQAQLTNDEPAGAVIYCLACAEREGWR